MSTVPETKPENQTASLEHQRTISNDVPAIFRQVMNGLIKEPKVDGNELPSGTPALSPATSSRTRRDRADAHLAVVKLVK